MQNDNMENVLLVGRKKKMPIRISEWRCKAFYLFFHDLYMNFSQQFLKAGMSIVFT